MYSKSLGINLINYVLLNFTPKLCYLVKLTHNRIYVFPYKSEILIQLKLCIVDVEAHYCHILPLFIFNNIMNLILKLLITPK
jgi:hypothetical protein